MKDSRFPDRPDHPDYWLMSQAVIDTDKVADSGDQPITDMVGRIVDTASLRYMAEQRAGRTVNAGIAPRSSWIALAAAWMDAFYAGTRYQHLKSTGAQEFPTQCGHDDDDELEVLGPGGYVCTRCTTLVYDGMEYHPTGRKAPTDAEGAE